VKKGDLLFTIDPRPFQAVLDQAKAQAALDQATLKRQEDLRARKVIAQQDYDIAVANAQKSKGAAEAAQVNLDFCFIKSPINGRIGLRNVDVGNLVGPSSPALVTIQGLDPIYTDFTVAENDLPLVRKYLGGPNVKVQTYLADGSITPRVGELYFIDHAVQPGSGTVRARGVTPNPDRALTPGLFARVQLEGSAEFKAMLVDDKAILTDQDRKYVYVLGPENKAVRKDIVTGRVIDGLRVVDSGLDAQDSVIIRGIQKIFEEAAALMRQSHCSGGCFFGNLAQEVADGNEPIRQKVAEHLDAWTLELAAFFERWRRTGYFREDFQPHVAAQAILSLLEGALLFCKASKSPAPVESAKHLAVSYLEAIRA